MPTGGRPSARPRSHPARRRWSDGERHEALARVDWHAHTLELTDFWTGLLLAEPHEPVDEVIESHRWLHEAEPFDPVLFDRWLEILDTTLDGGWHGPFTEAARHRGSRPRTIASPADARQRVGLRVRNVTIPGDRTDHDEATGVRLAFTTSRP